MNESRREAQRVAGRKSCSNLLTTAEALKIRERWKYDELLATLGSRKFEFEFGLGNYVFDLALLDVGILVEFDGPYHKNRKQILIDEEKERFAAAYGFVVMRRAVSSASTIDPSVLAGL